MCLRMSFLLFLLFFIIVGEAGKKEKQKIIIHVPYKIHKHHHTHTNYKMIKIPEKKEKTVIVYKEDEAKKPKLNFMPVPEHHKSLQAQQEMKKNPTNFIFNSHPVAEASYINGVIAPAKVPFGEDNVAQHSENQYKSLPLRAMMRGGMHVIKEPTPFKNVKPQLAAYQSFNKFFQSAQGRANQFIFPKSNIFQSKRLKEVENTSNESEEYEHVGYLIIDKNSHRIVGKNFENTVSPW